MSNPKRAVIFDLDGTLLDTIEDITDAMNHVLASQGYPLHDSETYKALVGQGIEEFVKGAYPHVVGADYVTHGVRKMRDWYSAHWNIKTQPYPGITDLLKYLTQNRIRMAVLSNKPDDFTKKMVNYYFPDFHFDPVCGARETVPRKPDPSGILEIIEASGLRKDEFLFVGDSEADILAASAAGIDSVGVTWGFRTADQLKLVGAHYLVDHPEAIQTLI